MADDEVMDYGAAAAFTGLAQGTVRAMVCRRQIPHLRLGPRLVRFRRSDLEGWLRERLVLPRPTAAEAPRKGGSR
ncbi:helix-turn-helix transcriptional regulator [Sorangium sp. So ce204]|uniref:helix-turn-helix transcriptional regulator n=1 Tax=unclassified Sorangium TaxID=2621164 RepID=UPI003F60379E